MKALLLSLLVACGSSKPAAPGNKPPINAAERNDCKVAEDCTLVDACCGCSAGGRRVAIRKDAVAEYDASRPQRCGDSMCTQVISAHSSCNAEAACENGRCKIMSHMGGVAP